MQPFAFMPWNMLSRTLETQRNSSKTLQTPQARAFSQFNRNVEHMMDMFFSAIPAPALQMMEQFMPQWKMDETDKAYTFELKVPGVEESDVELHVRDGRLFIQGGKNSRSQNKSGDNVTQLFGSSIFEQSIDLPTNIDDKLIEADFEDGRLTVTIPKMDENAAENSRIAIRNGGRSARRRVA